MSSPYEKNCPVLDEKGLHYLTTYPLNDTMVLKVRDSNQVRKVSTDAKLCLTCPKYPGRCILDEQFGFVNNTVHPRIEMRLARMKEAYEKQPD